MPCMCNNICDNDCGSNQICTGHVPACVNTYVLSGIIAGDLVRATDISTLQTAINQERTNVARRYIASDPAYCSSHTPGDVACSNNAFAAYSWTETPVVDDIVDVEHYNEAKLAINELVNDSGYGTLVASNFLAQSVDPVNSVILATAVTELQTRINQSRNVCICDSHCNCDPSDCGCNGECPSDEYYYA